MNRVSELLVSWNGKINAIAGKNGNAEKKRNMKGGLMKKTISDLTAEQKAELEALAALPDDQINTDDIPEVTDWSNAQRGLFYRSVKQQTKAVS
jgi:hypothetical protein